MTRTGIMAGTGMGRICTSSYLSLYLIEKVRNSPYPYPYSVNVEIFRQNGEGFGQYPRGRVYLPSIGRRIGLEMSKKPYMWVPADKTLIR